MVDEDRNTRLKIMISHFKHNAKVEIKFHILNVNGCKSPINKHM